MKKARLYTQLSGGRIRCDTCAHHCVVKSGATGFCGVMQNQQGTLVSLNYGRCAAMHTDPVEKKPLFHFLAGRQVFSVAASGCNMRCLNCQNWDLSQAPVEKGGIGGREFSPEQLVDLALDSHCEMIAYTYSEPAVSWDYAFETARAARAGNLRNIFVTNGFWSAQGLAAMAPYMDAANVDLKFFDSAHYRRICGAQLKPVLKTIRQLRESGVWLEVTTLIIPGLNDSDDVLGSMASFIADIDPDIPWHISRFHPSYRMQDRPSTPASTLLRVREIGLQKGLRYVYTGNLPGEEGESTFCPGCGTLLVRRFGFTVMENRLEQGRCPDCRTAIAGVWQ